MPAFDPLDHPIHSIPEILAHQLASADRRGQSEDPKERELAARAALASMLVHVSSGAPDETSNDIQRNQQNKMLSEGTAQVGMPAIKNFRERRQLKEIYELRDAEGLATYTYIVAEMTGKLVFLCTSIGYGIPASTQFTAPETMQTYNLGAAGSGTNKMYGAERLPQADPNGLFSPPTAEGTWITCLGGDKNQHVIYAEPRVVVSPFKLET